MCEYSSNIFESEEKKLTEAESHIYRDVYINNPLIGPYTNIIEDYRKLLKEFKKIVKISDGQQEYLQGIQAELKKKIDEHIKMEKQLNTLATIDALTGVYNRGTGLSILEAQTRAIKRNSGFFSICYIDVDKLKDVNDNYGHNEGDELIKIVCNAFRAIIRECDTICRLGGDEFLIILSECDKCYAEKTMERVVKSENYIKSQESKPYKISFSYGIAEVNGKVNHTIDEMIGIADKHMYKHKQRLKK